MSQIREIDEMISLFTELTGVGICFYDLKGFFSYDRLGKRGNVGHYCEFCRAVRVVDGGRPACEQSDRETAVNLAMMYDEPFFHKCHMGISELVVPIKYDGVLNGVVFLGQCRLRDADTAEDVVTGSNRLGLDPERMCELYSRLPMLSKDSLMKMGHWLSIYFSNLSAIRKTFPESADSRTESLPTAERIRDIIDKNYKQDISLEFLSKRLYLSREHILRVFKGKYGMGVNEYLKKVRVDNAKRILSTTRIPISNIAINVGFNDPNYFARVFQKETGTTPSAFRKKQMYQHK